MSKQNTDTDVAFISALAELLNKNDLTELSVKREYGEDDSLEVRVVKQANVVTVTAAAPAPAVHHAAPVAAAAAAPVRGPDTGLLGGLRAGWPVSADRPGGGAGF